MGIKRNTIIVLFLITVVALALIIYAVPGVTGLLVETYTAEYGELSIHDDTTGYFVRNERVYVAESSGRVNRLAEEGELLRPHTAVIELSAESQGADAKNDESPNSAAITGEEGVDPLTEIKVKLGNDVSTASDYRLETGGIVSFYVDGYENKLVPDNIESIKTDELEGINQSQVIELGRSASKDYPVFKIIDNKNWFLIAYIPSDHSSKYSEGQTVSVTFFDDDPGQETPDFSDSSPLFNKVEMTIENLEKEGDKVRLILSSIRYFGGIGEFRVAGCRIESNDVRGLLIENDSIVNVDGVPGVYVKSKTGKYIFTPIKIYGGNDTTTVVADTYFFDDNGEYTRTVDPFDDVLRTPEDADN